MAAMLFTAFDGPCGQHTLRSSLLAEALGRFQFTRHLQRQSCFFFVVQMSPLHGFLCVTYGRILLPNLFSWTVCTLPPAWTFTAQDSDLTWFAGQTAVIALVAMASVHCAQGDSPQRQWATRHRLRSSFVAPAQNVSSEGCAAIVPINIRNAVSVHSIFWDQATSPSNWRVLREL
eukprot:TRINITY_DN65662_c0_g1_i1.p1 TRINITY_DN65662_c0_g1~~TRINITY_DN65662_c0_g1_i1.p1  ORF type:complete len:175 (+),score=1.60 TRINITY_DN65662_c0_g1_i1:205-729(+)